MAETVKVSLLHPRRFKASRDSKAVDYAVGIREMPLEHARAMGLMNRIVKEQAPQNDTEAARVVRVPFDGAFDDKLTTLLTGAGFNTFADLQRLERDELLAIEGVGPANFERIHAALAQRQSTVPGAVTFTDTTATSGAQGEG